MNGLEKCNKLCGNRSTKVSMRNVTERFWAPRPKRLFITMYVFIESVELSWEFFLFLKDLVFSLSITHHFICFQPQEVFQRRVVPFPPETCHQSQAGRGRIWASQLHQTHSTGEMLQLLSTSLSETEKSWLLSSWKTCRMINISYQKVLNLIPIGRGGDWNTQGSSPKGIYFSIYCPWDWSNSCGKQDKLQISA